MNALNAPMENIKIKLDKIHVNFVMKGPMLIQKDRLNV